MALQFETPRPRSASLTSAQLVTLQRLWHVAGLPPVSGYGTALLAIAVASTPTLADMLPLVDFNNPDSVADAVEALLQWRQATMKLSRSVLITCRVDNRPRRY
jgi:hypothetical protein